MIHLTVHPTILEIIKNNCPMPANQLNMLFRDNNISQVNIYHLVENLTKNYGFLLVRGILFWDSYDELEREVLGMSTPAYYNMSDSNEIIHCYISIAHSSRHRFIQRFQQVPVEFSELSTRGLCNNFAYIISNTL